MSTSNEAILKLAGDLREENAAILEWVRERSVNDLPFDADTVAGLGRLLDSMDGGLRELIGAASSEPDAPTTALIGPGVLTPDEANAGLRATLDHIEHGPARSVDPIPSPDAIFESRRIVVHHDRTLCGFYAMRVGSGEAPCYGLGEDGWDEWRPSMRPVRVFETELQARYAAAVTALPGETLPAVPVETAVIVLCDCPAQEEVSISVTLHPSDALFGREDGVHSMARWILKLAGLDDVLTGALDNLDKAAGNCDGDPGDEHDAGAPGESATPIIDREFMNRGGGR